MPNGCQQLLPSRLGSHNQYHRKKSLRPRPGLWGRLRLGLRARRWWLWPVPPKTTWFRWVSDIHLATNIRGFLMGGQIVLTSTESSSLLLSEGNSEKESKKNKPESLEHDCRNKTLGKNCNGETRQRASQIERGILAIKSRNDLLRSTYFKRLRTQRCHLTYFQRDIVSLFKRDEKSSSRTSAKLC